MKKSTQHPSAGKNEGAYYQSMPANQSSGGPKNLLVLLLILLSFFSGYLFFKVKSLEQKGTTAVAAGTQQPAGNQPQAPQAPPVNYKAIPKVSDKDHIRGDKDADVVLIEYSDLECPFSKRFHPTMQQVLKDYGNKVAWVYRQYPLSFHQNAQKEAEATECVNELGGNDAFWSYVDKIFEKTTSNGTGFALDQLGPLAVEVGVNQQSFQQCLDSGKYAKQIQDEETAGTKAGVNGTPGIFIVAKNGKNDFIGGALPIEQVKQQIDAVLK